MRCNCLAQTCLNTALQCALNVHYCEVQRVEVAELLLSTSSVLKDVITVTLALLLPHFEHSHGGLGSSLTQQPQQHFSVPESRQFRQFSSASTSSSDARTSRESTSAYSASNDDSVLPFGERDYDSNSSSSSSTSQLQHTVQQRQQQQQSVQHSSNDGHAVDAVCDTNLLTSSASIGLNSTEDSINSSRKKQREPDTEPSAENDAKRSKTDKSATQRLTDSHF
jgi:hypothetical protein